MELRTIGKRVYRLAELHDYKVTAMNRADAHRIFGQISRYARVTREGDKWGVWLGIEKEKKHDN